MTTSNPHSSVSKSRSGPSDEMLDKTISEDLGIIGHGLNPGILLVSNNNILIREILKRNWIPSLLVWLSADHELHLQIGALWALTNIAAGPPEHTHTLIQNGAVPILLDLLSSDNDEILEQSVWVLGNLAGEGASSRDAVLAAGAIRPLVDCLSVHPNSQPLMKIGAWALSNICDGQPRRLVDISSLAPLLGALLHHSDAEVLSHTCWALSHLCDGPPTHLRALLNGIPSLCPRLVVLLSHRSWKIVKPALRTIGNIVCAEDEVDYTEIVTEAGAVTHLCTLVTHSNRDIQKEACWTLSNIAAGTVGQIQRVLDSGIMLNIVHLARAEDTDPEVRSEASWVVLNASSCGSDMQIEMMVANGSIGVLNDMLADPSMRQMALEGIERVLAIGEAKQQLLRKDGASSEESAVTAAGTRPARSSPNPYAMLLSVENIEALYNISKTTAMGKRVGKIFKEHFQSCSICHKSYHKNSSVLQHCVECKGPVCVHCDCRRYHLSYQEIVWSEIESLEDTIKKAQKESKKQKKKKQKAKKKKGGGGSGGGSGGGNVEEAEIEDAQEGQYGEGKGPEVGETAETNSAEDIDTKPSAESDRTDSKPSNSTITSTRARKLSGNDSTPPERLGPPSDTPAQKSTTPTPANVWAEKPPSIRATPQSIKSATSSAATTESPEDMSFMSVQRGRRKGKNASVPQALSTQAAPSYNPYTAQKSSSRPAGSISLMDAIPQATMVPAHVPAKSARATVNSSSSASIPRYADAVLRSAMANSTHGSSHSQSGNRKDARPDSTQDFPPLSAVMGGQTAAASPASIPAGKKSQHAASRPSPPRAGNPIPPVGTTTPGVHSGFSLGSGRNVPKGRLSRDNKQASVTSLQSSNPPPIPVPSSAHSLPTGPSALAATGNSSRPTTATSSSPFSYAAVAAAPLPAASSESHVAISPPQDESTRSADRTLSCGDGSLRSTPNSRALSQSDTDMARAGGRDNTSQGQLGALSASRPHRPSVISPAGQSQSVTDSVDQLGLPPTGLGISALSLSGMGGGVIADLHGCAFDRTGNGVDFPSSLGVASDLIMFGDINVPVSVDDSSNGSRTIASLPMGGGLDPSYVPYAGYGDSSRNISQSRLIDAMDGVNYDDPYRTDDQDIHAMHAEMLLGDDDDDMADSSREAADLVEFLQETGSIVALAERLGFRKAQSN